jgi:Type ISP C-terminal specificity domain
MCHISLTERAAVAHRGYTAKFREELEEPGIRVPLSTDAALWRAASTLGQQVIWLHTYGTRCLDSAAGRPQGERPIIEGYGVKCDLAIGALPDRLPDQLDFDAETLRLGEGALSPVARRVIDYDVGGRRVLWRWLNERARRPRLKKRTCAELDDITVPGWNHRLDRELLALLSVLTGCVSIERSQQDLLNQICDGPTISVDELTRANVTFDPPRRLRQHDPGHFDPLELFET